MDKIQHFCCSCQLDLLKNNCSRPAKILGVQQLTLHMKYLKFQQCAGLSSQIFQGPRPNFSGFELGPLLSFIPDIVINFLALSLIFCKLFTFQSLIRPYGRKLGRNATQRMFNILYDFRFIFRNSTWLLLRINIQD